MDPFTLGGLALGVGGSALSGLFGNRGSNNAAAAMQQATNQANQGLTNWQGTLQGMFNPYMQQGNAATSALSSLAFNPSYWQGWGGFNSTAGNATNPIYGASGKLGSVETPTPATYGGRVGSVGGPALSGGPASGVAVTDPYYAQGGLGSVEGPGGVQRGGAGGTDFGGPAAGDPTAGLPPGFVPSGLEYMYQTAAAAANTPQVGRKANAPSMFERKYARPWTTEDILTDPGMAYAKQQAMGDMDQRLAAMGLGQSGGALREAASLSGDIANKYFGEGYGRYANDRGFWAGRDDTAKQFAFQDRAMRNQEQNDMFRNTMQSAQLGQQAKQFGDQMEMQNRQFDWSQVLGNRDYDMQLRNQQLGLLTGLSGLGFNAAGQYGQLGTGIQNQIGQNILGQGNANAANAMNSPWAQFGSSLAGLGGMLLGKK